MISTNDLHNLAVGSEVGSNGAPVNSTLDEPASLSENEASPDQQAEPALKPLNFDRNQGLTMDTKTKKMAATLSLVAIIAGSLTGFGLYKLQAKTGLTNLTPGGSPMSQVAEGAVKNGDVFGSPDAETFKDSAQGYLEAGGLDGEGSHKLTRPGGISQTVYLTSSVTDLDKFVGMEVKIWGETFKAQQAGWLMDVGRVEVVNTDAQAPTEE